jgi:hypothetical protein
LQSIARESTDERQANRIQTMPTSRTARFFPHSEVAIVHQNGTQLTASSMGSEVILHTRENECVPCCAEVISGDHYAEIGLLFEGKELSDYDGVFSLPREVGEMLKDAGYVVPEECFN